MGTYVTSARLLAEALRSNDPTVGTRRWLARVPALRGLPEDALTGLATAVRLRSYDDAHDLQRGVATTADQPLRFVVHGRILRGSSQAREQAGAWVATTGSIVGLRSVDAWAHGRGEGWNLGRQARHDLQAQGKVWVLELDPRRFDEVLGAEAAAPLRRRLLQLVVADVDAPSIVAALRSTPGLRDLRVVDLHRVVETATARRVQAGATAVAGGLCWVATGAIVLGGAGRDVQTLAAGELDTTIASDAPARTLRALGAAVVVDIPRAGLAWARRRTPTRARTIETFDGLADAQLDVVIADPDLADARDGAAALAGALADDLDQRVARVTLVEPLDTSVEDTLLVAGQFGVPWAPAADRGPLRPPTTITLDVDRPLRDSVREALQELLDRWGLMFDHIVVDATALTTTPSRAADLWAATAEVTGLAKVSYLFDRPQAWHELPGRLGVLPPVDVLPVALGGRPVEAAEPREVPAPPSDGEGPEALGRWLARLTTGRATAIAPPAAPGWPLDAVRWWDASASAAWARAVSGRRVAVTIGGAGAQSFVAIPLLRALAKAGVPIDQIGGSSVGAFISVLWSAFGDRGLAHLEDHWRSLLRAVWLGLVDHRWLHDWLHEATEGRDLADLPIPAVVVSTEAHDLKARLHTSGSAAAACLASGSMPPLAPTYEGATRLVDGAVSSSVPAAALRGAGADLVVAVMPNPPVSPDPAWIRRPTSELGVKIRRLNPLLRYWDLARSFLAFARGTAQRGVPQADVVVRGSIQRTLAVAFWQGRRIVDHADASEMQARAVDAVVARWRRMTRPSPRRVRVWAGSGELDLGEAVDARIVGGATPRATEDLRRIVTGLATWLRGRSDLQLRVTVHVDLDHLDDAPRHEAAVRELVADGAAVVVDHRGAADGGPGVTLTVEPHVRCSAR